MRLFLKNILFRKLVLSDLFSALGQSLFDFVFILYASKFSNPELAISIAGTVASFPYIFSFFMGYLADQVRKPLLFLMVSKLIQSLIFLFLAFLSLIEPNWLLFSTFCLLNILSDWFSNLNSYNSLSLTQKWISEEELSLGLGFQDGVYRGASFLAQAIGTGLLIVFSEQYHILLFVNSILFLISFVFVFRLKDTNQSEFKERGGLSFNLKVFGSFFRDSWNHLKLVKELPQITKYILVCLLMNFLSSSIFILVPMSLINQEWMSIGGLAFTMFLITSIEAGMSILGSLFPIKFYRLLSLRKNLEIECFLFMFYVVNVIWIQNLYLLVILLGLISYFSGISTPKISTVILLESPEGSSNSILGIFRTLMTISIPIATSFITYLVLFVSVSVIWNIVFLISVLTFGYSLMLGFVGKKSGEEI